MKAQTIAIRRCVELQQMRDCVALQQEIWGFSDAELVPLRLFVVAGKIGGQVLGAYDGEEMVGFALAWPGYRNGHCYLHSQMVGVRKQYRDSGLGQQLKLAQRDDALARGFELMEWTFDPLEIKNAYLNIEKLGAIARRYQVNQYGLTTSPLQGGLPTDRLIAEWWMKSERVRLLLATGKKPASETTVSIRVPAEVYEWKSKIETRERAQRVQDENRVALLRSFSEGLSVLGYERDQHGNGTFKLGRWQEPWLYAVENPGTESGL